MAAISVSLPAPVFDRLRTSQAVPVVRVEGERTVIGLRGEWDGSTSALLADVLSRVIAGRPGDVVIDLAETAFIDSVAVDALAVGQQWLARRGRTLIFRSPSRLGAMMLEVFQLTDLIEAG